MLGEEHMAIRVPTHRRPTSPGEVLLEDFLKPLQMSQASFARHAGWTSTKLNEIITGKRGVTPATALTLADAFGTSADFWINLQLACDLYDAMKKHKRVKKLPNSISA